MGTRMLGDALPFLLIPVMEGGAWAGRRGYWVMLGVPFAARQGRGGRGLAGGACRTGAAIPPSIMRMTPACARLKLDVPFFASFGGFVSSTRDPPGRTDGWDRSGRPSVDSARGRLTSFLSLVSSGGKPFGSRSVGSARDPGCWRGHGDRYGFVAGRIDVLNLERGGLVGRARDDR